MANGFAKLKDGTWGVRVEGQCPLTNEWVDVIKKDGTKQKVQVKQVVWSGPNRFAAGEVHLCEIVPQAKEPPKPQAAPTAYVPNPDEEVPF